MSSKNEKMIDDLKARVLQGEEISREEAFQLINLELPEEVHYLQRAAHEITLNFNGQEPGLCSLINAKSNLCGEDCGFCSQSVRFDTRVDQYGLMQPEEVLKRAKDFEEKGANTFCVVTSGGELNAEEFEQVLKIYELLKKETSLNLDGSLGFLTPERVEQLKSVGVRRYNSNVQTSREHYPNIVSTHSYDKRLETLKYLLEGDMELCSGGILGMGETREDRVNMAFELKLYKPHCLPMNVLNPRPGTPLENQKVENPLEVAKAIAVYRFIHPRSNIKLAGGREVNFTMDEQETALQGGANGLIVGGYLTTEGNPFANDMKMLKRAGYKPEANSAEEPKETPAAS